MILVYTGDGKGKTTAAVGLCARAAGNGQKLCILQFLKNNESGEMEFLKQNGIEIHTLGVGFSWQKSPEEQREALREAWDFAKEKLCDKSYAMIVLDEINNVFANTNFKWQDIMPLSEVIAQAQSLGTDRHVVFTGRGAPGELISAADLVTEMNCVKHYFETGAKAMCGLEF